jgi:hypothetical protein
MLQAGRSRVPDTISLNFFSIYVILPAALGPGVYSAFKMCTRKRKKRFWGVKRSRCVRLTTSATSVSRLSRQCGILNIS